MKKQIKVALAGNPNCGKTTIFNKITNSRHKVANYPGVTVEKKEGILNFQNFEISIVDLPGIYDLNVMSEDEMISRKFILEEKPDIIVNIVDSSNIERSLFLTTQLMELEVPLLLVCNKIDLAKAQGVETDFEKLSTFLEVEIVESVGIKGRGIEEILKGIVSIAASRTISKGVFIKFSEDLEKDIDIVKTHLELKNLNQLRWKAIKFLENDPLIIKELQADSLTSLYSGKKLFSENVSSERQKFISRLSKEVVKRSFDDKQTISDRIDRIVTNKYLGLPIFILIMFLMFQMTFTLGSYPTHFLQYLIQKIAFSISSFWPKESLLSSLLIDGILSGVGSVITFFPNILLLFVGISLLEESGYMARAAFIMDRLMHKIGLHGKSFIPMLVGFGCTVPAVMASRILDNKRDKLTTLLVLPLFACSAKLSVFTLLIPAFFSPSWSGLVLFSLYFMGLFLAIVLIKILRKTLFKGENIPFIMEMPPFQMPSFKLVFLNVSDNIRLFFKKAGTFILAFCVVLWFLSKFPIDPSIEKEYEKNFSLKQNEMALKLDQKFLNEFLVISEKQKYQRNAHLDLKDVQVEKLQKSFNEEIDKLKLEKKKNELLHSYLGRFGKFIEPIFKPLGFDYKIDLSLISSIAAKEIFIGQLGILFADNNETYLQESLKNSYTPLTGLCVLLFLQISAPCIATFAITRKEVSLRFAIFQFFLFTLLAYLFSLGVFQLGGLVF